jgi:dipeptidyl-peptidase-4
MQWTNDSNVLSAQVLNRHQEIIWIYYLLINNWSDKSSFERKDKAYVDVTESYILKR